MEEMFRHQKGFYHILDTSLIQGSTNPQARDFSGREVPTSKGFLSHFRPSLHLNVFIRTWSLVYVHIRIWDFD